MKALKDPKLLAIVVGVVVIAAGVFFFRGSLFGSGTVPGATHINVLTGERHNWSKARYDRYYIDAAKSGKREVFPLTREDDGSLRLHSHYRDNFMQNLKDYGLPEDQVAQVIDLDTFRVIEK